MAHLVAVRPLPRIKVIENAIHVTMCRLSLWSLGITWIKDADRRTPLEVRRQDHTAHETGFRLGRSGRGPHRRICRFKPRVPNLGIKAVIVGLQPQLSAQKMAKPRSRMDMAIGLRPRWKGNLVKTQQKRLWHLNHLTFKTIFARPLGFGQHETQHNRLCDRRWPGRALVYEDVISARKRPLRHQGRTNPVGPAFGLSGGKVQTVQRQIGVHGGVPLGRCLPC